MKYIVDIPSELVLKDDGYSFSDGNSYCITGNLSKLTPYAEPDRNVIENEVWEFYKTISNMKIHEKESAFGTSSWWKVINKHSYQELKAKYEAWLEQKDDNAIKQKVIELADEIGIHKLYAIVRDIRGE